MKINKKVSTLALGLTLLLGIGAPMAVHASSCPHSPYAYTESYCVEAYTHQHNGKKCIVSFCDNYKIVKCHVCSKIFSKTYIDQTESHSEY